MKKKNFNYEWQCSWCGENQELTNQEYNDLSESPGEPGRLFKELICFHCNKKSYSPPPLTQEQWDNLVPSENFILESIPLAT